MLDDKFWVWETLEEATRSEVEELSEQDLIALMKAFGANYKGSDDLWHLFELRGYKIGADLF